MLWSLFLLACHPSDPKAPALTLSPSSGSSAGYYTVEADLAALGLSADEVLGVRIAGVAALDLSPTEHGDLRFLVQGAPEPGAADVALDTPDGELVFAGAFTYDPPVDPAFDRVVSLGASLSMGAVSGAFTREDATASAPALIASSAGAYLGLPLLVEGLLTPISIADLDGSCAIPSYTDHLNAAVSDLLSALKDPETGAPNPARGRLDPDLEVRNHAVAGTNLGEFLDVGLVSVSETALGHIINEPDGGLFDPLSYSQLALAEADAPTLILSLDPLVNDGVDAVTSGEDLEIESVTPLDALEPGLRSFVERLASTGAEVYLGNSPRPSALPIAAQDAARLVAAGQPEAEVADTLDALDEAVAAQNALLASVAAEWPNVHIVDFAAVVETIDAEGLDVGDTHLSTASFGGLISLDGIHYTHTGYAVMANVTLAALRDTLGVALDDIDLEAALAGDPLSPAALAAAGFDASACE